ncbi:MAG: FAD-dependent oxidoreductase, partial [Desulfobacterales bacterium]|nr:FAD-dependent oxidoreductase [Desulfobacterales bacterium]
MDKKYGVYICTGCGIGEALDIEELVGVPDEEGINCTTHPFLCSKEGVATIQKDIDDGKVNSMVIGACSRRVNFDVFNFDNCIVERANLREGCVWPHSRDTYPMLEEDQKDDEEHFDPVQMKAEDYIKMGMIRLEKVKLPEPYKTESFSKKILVMGGGVTGMAAALDAAKVGYDVTIVEKTAALGGYAAKLRNQMPVEEPFETLQAQ